MARSELLRIISTAAVITSMVGLNAEITRPLTPRPIAPAETPQLSNPTIEKKNRKI